MGALAMAPAGKAALAAKAAEDVKKLRLVIMSVSEFGFLLFAATVSEEMTLVRKKQVKSVRLSFLPASVKRRAVFLAFALNRVHYGIELHCPSVFQNGGAIFCLEDGIVVVDHNV
jgi:hypothetical protein